MTNELISYIKIVFFVKTCSLRVESFYRGLRKDCQMLLFSATYEDEVMRFAQAVIPNNPIVIRLRREEQSLDNIKQYFIECADQEGKFQALSNIYGSISIGQSMIFCAVSYHQVLSNINGSISIGQSMIFCAVSYHQVLSNINGSISKGQSMIFCAVSNHQVLSTFTVQYQ